MRTPLGMVIDFKGFDCLKLLEYMRYISWISGSHERNNVQILKNQNPCPQLVFMTSTLIGRSLGSGSYLLYYAVVEVEAARTTRIR